MVTENELQQIMPHLTAAKRALYLPHLQAALAEFEINTYLREAAFLAQIAHESAELRFFEEIWGPTAAQRRYEGRKDLGNVKSGDGKRYKGRGPIQLTGRSNYRKFGAKLGVDLEGNPAAAATPEVGFRTAGLFWNENGLNELADAQDFKRITRRINGGVNGLADREMYYRRALIALSKHDPRDEEGGTGAVNVVVNGTPLPAAAAILRGGHTLVALRPIAAAAGWRIVDTTGGRALLRDGNSQNHRVPLLIEDSVGYVILRELPGEVAWDAGSRTATLTT